MADRSNVKIPLWQPIFTVVFLAAFGLLTIWIGGDWGWTEGWIFVVLFWIACLITSARMYFKDPALFKERFSSPVQKDQKAWDKIVIWLIILTYVLWMVIAPLDARRYGWGPEFPIWLKAVGFVMAAIGFWLFYETFRENTFASPVIKIQEERKQRVISTGVYGCVRHPLYLGAALYILGGALLMGSLFGLLAGILFTVVVAARSVGEEKMLRAELEGYEEYTQRVRWRLIPFIF